MSAPAYIFGEYRLDPSRFSLLRSGRALKLERKPMELLILLAGSGGRLVTREEIAGQLWEREVFVDTEHGINTAIRKIRLVLREDPEEPRFLQTVTGKGYRFIASVTPVVEEQPAPAMGAEGEEPAGTAHPLPVLADVSNAFAREGMSSRASAPPADALPDREEPGEMKSAIGSGAPLQRKYPIGRTSFVVATLGLCALAAVVGRPYLQAGIPVERIHSVAVLPLDNFSHDAGQDYLADGLTDELITQLAKHSTLRVVSRTSVMQFKGSHPSMADVARRLGVDAILEGSMARTGPNVHFNLQLIEAATDAHVWAETYDRSADDLVALPREAAVAISESLHSAAAHTTPDRPVLPAAHDAYLRGRDLWFNGPDEEALLYFRKATELQPDYALGWSGLSIYYGAGAVTGRLAPADSLEPELSTALKAVQLDDLSAEAHLALGSSYFIARADAVKADAELLRAIELNPKFAEAHHFRAKMLAALNRHDEAIREQSIATELDPFARPWALELAYLDARRWDLALHEAQLRLEQTPYDPTLLGLLQITYHWLGRDREAAEAAAQQALLKKGGAARAAEIRADFARAGYAGIVEGVLARDLEHGRVHYVSPFFLASSYALLGRKQEALSSLEKAYGEHSPPLLWMQCYPEFDSLRDNPRYQAIVKGMNLPLIAP